jgi:hypothetical protein
VKLLGVVPLVCTTVPTFTDAPVETNVATNAVRSVPKGTEIATVFEDSVIVPVAAGLAKLKLVKAFAGLAPMVTVTTYACVLPSAATTVYVTGLVKLFGVVPLVCTTVPTFTDAPVETNVAFKAVTFVPEGTDIATVFEESVIVPVTAGVAKLKLVKAFAVFGPTVTVTMYACVPPSPATTV